MFLLINLALGALLHQVQALSPAQLGVDHAAVFQIGQQAGLRQGDAHGAVQALAREFVELCGEAQARPLVRAVQQGGREVLRQAHLGQRLVAM